MPHEICLKKISLVVITFLNLFKPSVRFLRVILLCGDTSGRDEVLFKIAFLRSSTLLETRQRNSEEVLSRCRTKPMKKLCFGKP